MDGDICKERLPWYSREGTPNLPAWSHVVGKKIGSTLCNIIRDFSCLNHLLLWIDGCALFVYSSLIYVLEVQLAKLVEMGFSEDIARTALESCGGDENAALEKLCSG